MRVKRLLRLVAAVGILLALSGASAAMARPAQPGPAAAGDPVRFWSVSRVDEGAGEVPVGSGAQAGGKLQEAVDVGHVVFNLPLHAPYWYFLPRDRAFGSLFSSADGVQYSVLAPGFGDFGIADTDPSGGDDFGDDIVLDSNGGIVVVGTASSPTVTDMALVRYRLDGTLDTFLTTDFHGAGDFGHALAVDPAAQSWRPGPLPTAPRTSLR
jgi:hypothetical protein